MAVTIDQYWSYRFHDQIHLQYQQGSTRLQDKIDPMMVHRDVSAAIDHHERLGALIANDVISPFGQTKILNPLHSRRAVALQSSDAAVLVSDENTLRSMVNPQNAYTQTIVAALGRRADLHVINDGLGSAQVASVTAGTGVITYATQAMLSANYLGTSVTSINLSTIIKTAALLSKSACPHGAGERIFAYAPGQLADLLAITQASSSDFTKNTIHDRGTINNLDWEGFTWVEIPDVLDPANAVLQRMLPYTAGASAAAPATRTCMAFHKSAIGLSIGRDITTKINERPDLNNSIQVRSVMMQAAVRVWDAAVCGVYALEN